MARKRGTRINAAKRQESGQRRRMLRNMPKAVNSRKQGGR